MSVFKIVPTSQKYEWGKVGRSSKVALLAEAGGVPHFTIDETAPYAELWMGTHPKSPSLVAGQNVTLADHLKAHPELIGERILNRYEDASEGNLPFLFKVLSIEKALSIQSHPDKKTAEELFKKQPDIYKDPNHKPEMALALTPFRALCGFRRPQEIANFLRIVPELAALIPATVLQTFISGASTTNTSSESQKTTLKNLFRSVMTAPSEVFTPLLRSLISRYRSPGSIKKEQGETDDLIQLVLRLNDQFPGDIGIFCPFLLNYITLQPGEAIFLGAGEPHAYISGECMECMANSDNVIRAGLTPKLRDIANLVSTLTYNTSEGTKHFVSEEPFSAFSDEENEKTSFSTLYDPPIPEFSVVAVEVPSGKVEKHRAVEGPSLTIATEGTGIVEWTENEEQKELEIRMGDVFFVGKGIETTVRTLGEKKFVVYRAFVEDREPAE